MRCRKAPDSPAHLQISVLEEKLRERDLALARAEHAVALEQERRQGAQLLHAAELERERAAAALRAVHLEEEAERCRADRALALRNLADADAAVSRLRESRAGRLILDDDDGEADDAGSGGGLAASGSLTVSSQVCCGPSSLVVLGPTYSYFGPHLEISFLTDYGE
jgi:hypothetical protein